MATVFQAEVIAIERCAQLCIGRHYPSDQHIVIASDSQAALRALTAPMFKSKLVLECRQTLNSLGEKSILQLIWVPGHENIEGNEEADKLAKKGSEARLIGPEPYCGFNQGNCREVLEQWERKIKIKNFQDLDIDSHSRLLIEINKRKAKEALLLSKSDLRLLVGILTGHCGLKAHLIRIRKESQSSILW